MPVTRKRKQEQTNQTQSSQPAKTSFEFSSITKYQAYYRQWNRCACCGQNLSFQQGVAHHVIRSQTGNTTDSNGAFLRAVDNCVILCKHCDANTNQNYGKNLTASPATYGYSHGLERITHQQWANKLSAEQQGKKDGTKYKATISMLH
jgi:5-methylcytosine-specific restriction endonuclease McrA